MKRNFIMYKIVNTHKESMNIEKFGYVLCPCCKGGEAIEIPRPSRTGYIPFRCPRCNESLGIILESEKDFAKKFDKL
jgi:hypothetical protein